MNKHSVFNYCIKLTSADGFPTPVRGKVRDVYDLKNGKLAIVATDRVSAFDHILPEPIPFKGQILNRLAAFAMEKVADIIPTHLISVPHPNITIAHACKPLPVEVVVRGYLAGHAWRVYSGGERMLCGNRLPEGLRKNEAFPEPIITPTTKATEGHDVDITEKEIVDKEMVDAKLWNQVRKKALELFRRGTEVADGQELILVDTKYEFGLLNNELTLIDEVHTADSSRYFYKDNYEENLKNGNPQDQLSKEFIREWLMERNFMGKAGQVIPHLPEDFRLNVYNKYAELFNRLTGEQFTPVYTPDFDATLSEILNTWK